MLIRKDQMKKSFKSIAILGLTLLFSTISAQLTSALSYTTRDIPTHITHLQSDITIEGLFYDDLPSIPYITLESYFGNILGDATTATVSGGNYSYTTAANPNNAMVVNPENDTIYFANYSAFLHGGSDTSSTPQQLPSYLKNPRSETIGTPNPVTLDLKKYHIDLRAENGTVYFPLPTLSDLFSIGAYIGASYTNEEIIAMLLLSDNIFTEFSDSSVWSSATRSQELVDFSYSELCFIMDYLYGKPDQATLAPVIEEKGFDRALKETSTETQSIYTLLHSTDMVDYFHGLYLLDAYLYDGGHTILSARYIRTPEESVFYPGIINVLQTQTTTELGFTSMSKTMEKVQTEQTISTTRDTALAGSLVQSWPDGASYYENGDTGIFVFNAFLDEIIPHFKWALDHAVESGMQNFLIDLATNGGGSSAVIHYILSIVADDYQGIDNITMLDKNHVRTTFDVDKNLDGNIDALDDAYHPDLNFAFLTSKLSFSCGNLLPSLAKDHGIAILGEQSGGGTCTSSRGFYPNGLPYVISGFGCFVNADGEEIDAGVTPHYLLAAYDGFYDFYTISRDIHEFYDSNNTDEPSSETVNRTDDGVIIPLAPNSGKA